MILPPASTVARNLNFRRDVFDLAATDAGLAGLTPHELRHTGASLAVSAGANVKVVQRTLGHASAAMTLDVNSGLFDDDLDAVAVRLDEAAAIARVPRGSVDGPYGEAGRPLTCTFIGAAYRNRTDDLFITSESLWPTELRRRAARGLPCGTGHHYTDKSANLRTGSGPSSRPSGRLADGLST